MTFARGGGCAEVKVCRLCRAFEPWAWRHSVPSSWCSCSFRTPHLLCTGRWTALRCKEYFQALRMVPARLRGAEEDTEKANLHPTTPHKFLTGFAGSKSPRFPSLHQGASRSSHVHREQCLGLLANVHPATGFACREFCTGILAGSTLWQVDGRRPQLRIAMLCPASWQF